MNLSHAVNIPSQSSLRLASVMLALKSWVVLEAIFRRDGEDGGWWPRAVLRVPLGNGQRLNFSLDPGLELNKNRNL